MTNSTATLTDMEIELKVNWNFDEYTIISVESFKNSATFLLENLDRRELNKFKPEIEPTDEDELGNEMIINFYQLSHEDQCQVLFDMLEGGRWYDEIYVQINITDSEFRSTLSEINAESIREEL